MGWDQWFVFSEEEALVASSVTLSSVSWHSMICLLPPLARNMLGLEFAIAHVPLLLCV